MNSGQNEAAAAAKKEKVFETQQRTQESGSENEASISHHNFVYDINLWHLLRLQETDSITDQSSQSKSTKSATQFSVQRSDTDGLRMKISAIRNPPTSSLITVNKKPASAANREVAAVATDPTNTRKKLTKVRKMSDAQHEASGCSTEAKDKHKPKDDTVLSTQQIVNTTKKMKVKRKKFATKSNNLNNNNINNNNNNGKSKRPSAAAFSSDSEDDLPLKMHMQRAPRLLLTAIAAGVQTQADNIGISSSDNEYLPNLVKAAIKCVESDTEDTSSVAAAAAAKTKQQLPQYQSTLLQDFMEKTQMLNHTGSNAASLTQPTPQPVAGDSSRSYVPQLQPQQPQRKRRGRPKKLQPTVAAAAVAAAVAVAVPTINESADSGVISTTPSPKMQQAALSDNPKPKIDMAYLDKRMYATERVLYPPPRSKRRQSNKKANKEELQVDPLWRKIDVNKKFRLRSVSGYKSDGGGGGGGGSGATSNTICSKILAAKSGYVSDYGSVRHQRHNHNSGYKSDASCKSRYSSRSCASRRMSRAKSCGYRSDCKESSGKSSKSLRRRRRASMLKSTHEQTASALSDDHDQDILQLAGLSLGQSSEESNEYISKPSLKCLPSTSASKKYGEINRFVTTGQYFSGATKAITGGIAGSSVATVNAENFMQGKMQLQRKHSISGDTIVPSRSACKIKSRRSSAASMCSSYVSSASRMRRRHRRKSFSHAKSLNIDSKLLTEIDIIASTFHARCRIQDDRLTASSGKEKLLAEANKLQATLTAPIAATLPLLNGSSSNSNGPSSAAAATKPVKRALKKRKLNEPLIDFAMLSASAGHSNSLSNTSSSNNGAKRRHKKSSSNSGGSNSSSPDDHKLPLKKRHYLVTTGADVSTAFASNGKLNAEAWAAAAAAAKSSANTKAQAQFNAKKLTPKKRHLLVSQEAAAPALAAASAAANASPLRIVVDNNSISGGKLLDISPSSLCSLKQHRRQGGKSKSSAAAAAVAGVAARELPQQLQSPAGSSSCPPPGIFEPSVELEIQIPIAKLNEAVITKSEVESPLLAALDIKEDANKKEQCQRVLETLLHKTGGNLLLKRKRKKINRTGFPTVRRKKRKVSSDQTAGQPQQQPAEQLQPARETRSSSNQTPALALDCERVPQAGEARETFVARSSNQRTPRLSVVALERLQRPQTPANPTANGRGRPRGRGRPKLQRPQPPPPPPEVQQPLVAELQPAKKRGRAPKQAEAVLPKLERKLESSIKLPAGVDPNTNFSCKIRLKRRKNMQQEEAIGKPAPPPPAQLLLEQPTPQTNDEQAAIEAEAAAKRSQQPVPANEHDALPVQESTAHQALDYASCSDTSEDKCSTTSQRKRSKLKKNYLLAGLFSNHYKQLPAAAGAAAVASPAAVKQASKKMPGSSLLPPPSYCERYFRRAVSDFELPYDIWWAYSHDKLPTRHVVPSWNYRKIRTNVYAESVRPNLAGFDHPNCNCKPQASGACLDNCLNRMVYTECAPSNCPAGDKCRNQKIQRHEVAPGVERFMTTDKGWGVRTKLPIAKGTYILEYVGEVVTEREFKQRMASIYLNDTHHYCLHLDGGLVIDGQRMGSDCRFVNHSCEPNCEMQKWSVNGLSRMVLFAKRAIEQGEELTYDYNFSLFNPSEGQPCRCNMPQCRGVIGGKSQRIKPLPVEAKAGAGGDGAAAGVKDATTRNGRQRKHKAKKHAQRQQQAAKEAEVVARVQQLSEKEKKLVKQCSIFLVRNFEKIRRCKAKKAAAKAQRGSPTVAGEADVPGRRPSTPSSTSLLAAQISALCTPRNMKTRGLTQAVQDPELEKMAKMAVVLRDICTALESVKMFELLTTVTSNKKKKQLKASRLDFKAIQAQVEQGHYKTPLEYDEQMQQLFVEVRQLHGEDEIKTKALETLMASYEQQKANNYAQLLEILGKPELLQGFKSPPEQPVIVEETQPSNELQKPETAVAVPVPQLDATQLPIVAGDEEDVIRCICGLYKDEGLMIQCAKCMVWQHTECTKADIDAENYQCERCEPREVDREIPLDDFTEEGHRYYLSLMRGDLQVRQGDAVYVLRDIPIKDEAGKVLPSQKHTYETIGAIDYQECDIFRVEHLWKNEEGKRFIFGHHFLRPHETFHEPSRRFYPNEVVRVSLYEVVPIELVIGRCWVLDRTTFCKGRPMECVDEDHCFICELRVDKTARFFSKAKANHPACTKSYAFRKFPEKLKISKSYAVSGGESKSDIEFLLCLVLQPHDVDPSLLKTRKQKTDIDVATTRMKVGRQEQRACPTSAGSRKQRNAQAATAGASAETAVQVLTPTAPNGQVLKKKRSRLENVLNTMKLKCLDAQTAQEQPIDLSYLLSGRGARQRKTNCNSSNSNNNSNSATPCA
ncbi:hypothetical protein KR093_006987 [Drosophila rubida]|uniref:Histone-lysine N-methyltransferase ash1 n=1 Tax=Drosophila rubida TaxID=30044 RepID=A0AAD4PLL7_9MUSC|nr:hypothetical protein KR093_006987 [Drosophila rubida]